MGKFVQTIQIFLRFSPVADVERVADGIPLLFVLTHKGGVAEHVGKEFGAAVSAVATIGVGTEDGLTVVFEESVARGHVRPVEVETCIPVPGGSEGELAVEVAEQEYAAGCREFDIVEILLQLQHGDVRGDVHERIDQGIVLGLDGTFEHGKFLLDAVEFFAAEVFGRLHSHRHAIDGGPEVVAAVGTFRRAVIDVEGE